MQWPVLVYLCQKNYYAKIQKNQKLTFLKLLVAQLFYKSIFRRFLAPAGDTDRKIFFHFSISIFLTNFNLVLVKKSPINLINFIKFAGLCKGYGLAEFKDECGGLQARHVLHDTDLRGHSIHCEWLKPGKYTQKLLQSKVSPFFINSGEAVKNRFLRAQ